MNVNDWTYGHCARKKAQSGCQLHNLQCGYPDCDRKRAAAPSPAPVPVDAAELEALRELDRLARLFAKQQQGTQAWSLRALYLHEHVNAALAANGEKGT